MTVATHDIIRKLQQDILPLQGFKPVTGNSIDINFPLLEHAFPNATFPTGAVHEFISSTQEGRAATSGFAAALMGKLMESGGACLWIGSAQTVFTPALQTFGAEPHKIIFVNINREKDKLWVMEEALKCERLAAVAGEIRDISFTDSRRLQLAVEKSKVTGFLFRHQPRNLNTIACIARWKITALASETEADMPGIGFPAWQVELLKVRNGKPGVWQIEWTAADGFRSMDKANVYAPVIQLCQTA